MGDKPKYNVSILVKDKWHSGGALWESAIDKKHTFSGNVKINDIEHPVCVYENKQKDAEPLPPKADDESDAPF